MADLPELDLLEEAKLIALGNRGGSFADWMERKLIPFLKRAYPDPGSDHRTNQGRRFGTLLDDTTSADLQPRPSGRRCTAIRTMHPASARPSRRSRCSTSMVTGW